MWQRTTISAKDRSIASGRDTIIGVRDEVLESLVRDRTKLLQDLADTQKATLVLLQDKLQLNERQILAALDAAGEAKVPPEDIGKRLIEIAGHYRVLREEVRPTPSDNPRVAELKAQAAKAIENGALERADACLADLAQVQEAVLERAALDVAATHARRGEVALARLRYQEAADHFAAGSRRVPPGHEEQRLAYLHEEAAAFYRQGSEFGHNGALVAAIERCCALLVLYPRERVPLDWAETQNSLGIALLCLGQREAGTARLEEAVEAFRAALEERTRERVPLEWAITQTNLGTALQRLGEREASTAKLEDAVEAYRDALKELTRERVPLEWAMTHNNLGMALRALGDRESGTVRLKEAVAAYRAALEEHTREGVPLEWARAQNNLGTALVALSEREAGTARLEEAAAAYRAALEEWTRERVPLEWARAQNNLGIALWRLSEREAGTARLEEAIEAFRTALEEFTRERVPLDWAGTQNNLGAALVALSEREAGTAHLEKAIEAYRDALKELTRERVPLEWAATQYEFGAALQRLGEREAGRERFMVRVKAYMAAAEAYLAALEEITRARAPLQWAKTQNNLGLALWALSEWTAQPHLLERGPRSHDGGSRGGPGRRHGAV